MGVWQDRRQERKKETQVEDFSCAELISDSFYLLLTILNMLMGMGLVGIQWKILTPKRLMGKVPWCNGLKVKKSYILLTS